MTGHLLFNQIDPQNVSTCSQIVVNQVIRETIGFKGLLMGDDVSMQALSGTINERGEGSLAAGCDLILHCNGVLDEMEMIAHIAPTLTGASKERALHVEQLLKSTATPIENTMEQRWGELLSDIFKPAWNGYIAAMSEQQSDSIAKPAFEEGVAFVKPDGRGLKIDVSGFEGPLDILLSLARTQKVDLRQISILQLAEQYIAFIRDAQALKLEVAADYLVMASWLAYLKSRLLLPVQETEDEVSAEEVAARLVFRLQRLEAMREAASQLMARDLLGRDVFQRGMPDGIRIKRHSTYEATLYEVLSSYI